MSIEFAVIGTNFITDRFLEAAKTVPEFHLKAVCSRTREKGEAFARKHGAELVFDDLDALAACTEVDAVYIATPNCCHMDQSIRMMRGGKHVLCEKPVASNAKEFARMRAAAEENGVVLLEAMRNYFSPGFAAIRENLPKLGAIRRVSFEFCQYSSRYDKFRNGIIENAFNPDLSNGALMDIGVYCVHPMAAMFGMPEKITGSSQKLRGGVEGAGVLIAQYDGFQVDCTYSKIYNSQNPSQIQGEDGVMVIREVGNPRDVTIHYRKGGEEKLVFPSLENNMPYEIQTFLDLIRKGSVHHRYLDYSRMELEIMDEMRRQQGIVFPADR